MPVLSSFRDSEREAALTIAVTPSELDAGLVPVVVMRDGDGGLRGFVNVCRHRGHPVALEDGNARRLQCRYHGWTYGLDGRLTGAPRCRLEPGFDKSELGLQPVAVDVWRDLVFVNL